MKRRSYFPYSKLMKYIAKYKIIWNIMKYTK